MSYVLFILLNAALFVRPAEISPALGIIPIYNITILSCLAASLGPLLRMFGGHWAREQPTSLCVFGLLIMIFVSNLVRLDINAAIFLGIDFAKVTIYYALLVVTLNTPTRLRNFLQWLALLTLCVTLIALLNYYNYITIDSLELINRVEDENDEGMLQLKATGIFDDPNDFCSILGVSILIAVSLMADKLAGMLRFLWVVPTLIYTWAFLLTGSRGGLLGLLSGIATLFVARFGWRRAVPLGVIALPAFLMLVGGRQARISTGEGTALQRMGFWLDGFQMLVRSPVFGIGAGQFVEHVGYVAHNSIVQASVELGFLGGSFFLGVFYFAAWSLMRLDPRWATISDPQMRRLRPYLLAMIVGFFVSLMSISRNYTVTTYIIPGVIASYLRVINVTPTEAISRLNLRMIGQLSAVHIAVLLCLYALVRSTIR